MRHLPRVLALLLPLLPGLCAAQTTAPPATSQRTLAPTADNATLDAILVHLRTNLEEYRRTVRTFFCDEHVVSDADQPGVRSLKVVTDSTFRLRRTMEPNGHYKLEESRTIRTVNGKPVPAKPPGSKPDAQSQPAAAIPDDETPDVAGPAILTGGFSNSLNMAQSNGRACYAYRLLPPPRGQSANIVAIDIRNLPRKERAAECPPTSNMRARALVDTDLMRVVHMEQTTVDYEITHGIIGTWDWTVDYAPVPISGHTFWLPTRTSSKTVAERTLARGTFTAAYTNCHKLEVSSRILSPQPESQPQP